MSRLRSTCRLLRWAGVLLLLATCARPPHTESGKHVPERTAQGDPRGYDPLELDRDRDVIPAVYPRQGQIGSHAGAVADRPGSATAPGQQVQTRATPLLDTLSHQVYRVQLFTAQTYGEARGAMRVAEEVFDQPVYLDYEVPYFKVRVGDFANRFLAEDYQQKVKAAGYPTAWVVMVNVGVQQAAPLYDTPIDSPGGDRSGGQDSASDGSAKK